MVLLPPLPPVSTGEQSLGLSLLVQVVASDLSGLGATWTHSIGRFGLGRGGGR